ncbi:hypothetical protein [Micromonospora sp. NPDC050495]|uniref:hypothetical protein n=1 Tax=Micromonospora sp. NPDC050495 TaxID=3154936 RepID=UPI0033C5478A
MKDEQRPRPGLGRRRSRLSDEETARRMLEAATAAVNRSGLTVSLGHISFEDAIRDAGVSRSAAYRRWPYKDLFFSDLLTELARAATPAAIAHDETSELIRRVALDHLDWLTTPELRHALGVELLRQGALRDFETMYGSTEWRTYLALHATFMSLDDGDLRAEVQSALGRSEQGFISRIATSYERVAGLIGYRLRPETGATFETLATLASATMRGLVIMALSTPDIAIRRVEAEPFGAAEPAEWSLPAAGIAGLAFTFLEPDPTVEWDDGRIRDLRETLESPAGLVT